MSNCLKCNDKLSIFSFSFAAFPFYFKCNSCDTRLKLISSKSFWFMFLSYVLLMFAMLFFIPLTRVYNIGALISILGWFILYGKVLPYMLTKEKIELFQR